MYEEFDNLPPKEKANVVKALVSDKPESEGAIELTLRTLTSLELLLKTARSVRKEKLDIQEVFSSWHNFPGLLRFSVGEGDCRRALISCKALPNTKGTTQTIKLLEVSPESRELACEASINIPSRATLAFTFAMFLSNCNFEIAITSDNSMKILLRNKHHFNSAGSGCGFYVRDMKSIPVIHHIMSDDFSHTVKFSRKAYYVHPREKDFRSAQAIVSIFSQPEIWGKIVKLWEGAKLLRRGRA